VTITTPITPITLSITTTLSIIIPTYNERTRLGELVETISGVFAQHRIAGEIVIVDDNSPDGTGQFADSLSERYPVRVVHRPGKLGLGSAVIEGFAVAKGDVLGVMDADLSHPPEALPRMLDALNRWQADLVIGSRYVAGGGTRNWPFVRRAMSRFACLIARPLTAARDATSGYFLIRRHASEAVRIQARGFKICLELLVRGRIHTIVEVPYEFTDRAAGESKMSWREASGYFRQVWELYRYQRAHPQAQTYHRAPPQQH
jgi:dolichol-phosphate mannosyltransferase